MIQMFQLRYKHLFIISIAVLFVLFVTFLRGSISQLSSRIAQNTHEMISPEEQKKEPKKPKYKEQPSVSYPPVEENFPLAQAAHSASDLPPIPSWNAPPSPHVAEKTPLFIGFTRNWRVLQQAVVSYITAGWPAEDIYVIENTGVMDSNAKGLLSLQNPFYLNHTRLEMLGVNVVYTPTLFTFAQLQNFYLYTSIQKNWDHYFWSHMDVIVASFEDGANQKPINPNNNADSKNEEHRFRTLYGNCLHTLRKTLALPKDKKWAMRFFSYDRLALVNVQTFKDVGGWDTMIPFYTTDCDMHFRLTDSGYSIEDDRAGMVYDVAASLDDLSVLYRQKPGSGPSGYKVPPPSFQDPNLIELQISEAASRNATFPIRIPQPRPPLNSSEPKSWGEDNPQPSPSRLFVELFHTFDAISASKYANERGRNTWQARAKGGKGEPFYRDSEGFEQAIKMTIEHGKNVYAQKWGHRDCDLPDIGVHVGDEWRVVQDW